jgi:hypothetical protein
MSLSLLYIHCKIRASQHVPRALPSSLLAVHACRILAIALEARSAIRPMSSFLCRYASNMHAWCHDICTCTYLDLTLPADLASCRWAPSIRHFVSVVFSYSLVLCEFKMSIGSKRQVFESSFDSDFRSHRFPPVARRPPLQRYGDLHLQCHQRISTWNASPWRG